MNEVGTPSVIQTEAKIARIEGKVAAAERRFENGTRFLTGKLAEYFETMLHKTTKTKHSYRLLFGKLVEGVQIIEKPDTFTVDV